MDKGIERRTAVNVDDLKHSKNDEKIENSLCYNSLGKYQIQGRRKEQLYTKDKTALNVILSDCTRPRTFSQYVYGGSIFHS